VGQLYEQDLYLWAETTAHLLRENRFSEIELDALIEELGDISKREKRDLQRQLEKVIINLLKWRYVVGLRTPEWRFSTRYSRQEIKYILDDSPSLKQLVPHLILDCYLDAREFARMETGLDEWRFPEHNPFTTGQILDRQFFPE